MKSLFFSRLSIALISSFFSLGLIHAEVRLPKIFGSHMVLQQGKPIQVWGWANPGESATVQIGAAKQTAVANAQGEWKLSLPAMKAGGPHLMKVHGTNEIVMENIMIGEVWLCSGQSNMEMGMKMFHISPQEIAAANHPNIRLMLVENRWTERPQRDIEGTWKVCTPQSIAEGGWNGFSATAYYFGRELQQQLGVAVGLIDADWGGTRIESWTAPEGFAAVTALREESDRVQQADPRNPAHQQRLQQALSELDQWHQSSRAAWQSGQASAPAPTFPAELRGPQELQQATALYNGMIHPLAPIGIRGAIWYQGESNMGDGMRYADRMKALISGWRQVWQQGDFPFYFVQIAPFLYPDKPPQMEPEIWEAQTVASQTIPNTGMVVINDVGELQDIHPQDKRTVGFRLASLALAKTYGKKQIVHSGPVFQSIKKQGQELHVHFEHAHGGLTTRDGKAPDWFEIIDAEEGDFVAANARISGNKVILASPQVKNPVAMRFAWSHIAMPNLMNGKGLPAGAFRAALPVDHQWLKEHAPDAKDYEVIYDLDLKKLGAEIVYDQDHHRTRQKNFDRIAYYLELQDDRMRTKQLFVSMKAFTDDLGKIGIPTVSSGAVFQQDLEQVHVVSNVTGIPNGKNMSGCNIEFWPHNYSQANAGNVVGASAETYDFGDQRLDDPNGYGSMQIHHPGSQQTLFAINHWRDGLRADVGIGNQPTGERDWTFAANAGSYRSMRLRVLIRPSK